MNRKRYTYALTTAIILLLLPSFVRAQSRNDEIGRLRLENARLRKAVDSLSTALSNARKNEVYDVWSGLSELPSDGKETDGRLHSPLSDAARRLETEEKEMAAKIRLAAPFLIIPYDRVENEYINFYGIQKRREMTAILKRYEKQLPMIREIFSRYDIPEDVMSLCIVESAVNPNAVSKAGAVGMWQFMDETAREFGLDTAPGRDQRRDPVLSTEAAAQYLKRAYKQFGRWDLAILSYNCGPAPIRKAIVRSGGKDGFWDIHPYLPDETKGYLLSLIAIRYIQTFGLDSL